MSIQRMDHVGIVVDDLGAAVDFFTGLGLEELDRASVEGGSVDRVVGLEGVRSDLVFMQTRDGHSRLELVKFHAPPGPVADQRAPSNAPGMRHLCFEVDELAPLVAAVRARGYDLVGEVEAYEDIYRLCYVRGPEGLIIELAERIG